MENLLSFWRKGSVRSLTYQWGLVVVIICGMFWVYDIATTNMARLGLKTGFDFLTDEAGFPISPALIDYSPRSTYIEAMIVTLLNTIFLSLIAIILATILGFFIAMFKLSSNLLLRKFGNGYVEVFRNVPLLLQLFFWYFAALKMLPMKRSSISFFDVAFLNIEGFFIPLPILEGGAEFVAWAVLIATLISAIIWAWAKHRQKNTGQPFPSLILGAGLIILLPLLVAWVLDFPVTWEVPKFGRFNFEGGTALEPEFTAMVFGLTLYNAAFVGEIIRAGIQSVDKGQKEAAGSIGFTNMQTYSQVIVPQAMRFIIPPITNQYLSLAKSTALAGAIGYADFFWAMDGAIAPQTGQVMELQAITLAGYLGISLFIAMLMAIYNHMTRIPER
ncbi:MAG TPA: ABC transporter permease subunit [Rhodospirillales bacterium]|jgi:general L-amino acid transport system permease protein|nr:ABC transporter permease subunit [Rhodospirillales bacterium]